MPRLVQLQGLKDLKAVKALTASWLTGHFAYAGDFALLLPSKRCLVHQNGVDYSIIKCVLAL
jgi:hypothetical protein